MTETKSTSTTPFATRKPRKGQRIIVHGAHISGGVPASGGGTYASYHGVVNGHVVIEGNTSDRTFINPANGATWEPWR